MKKIIFCLFVFLFSESAFALCTKPTSTDKWTLFAEINKYRSIVGKGTLLILPSGAIDASKSSMTLVWKLLNVYPYSGINVAKSVPLSGNLAIDAQCNVTGVIKSKTPVKKKNLQFNFYGKMDGANKNEVNGIFYALNNPKNIVNGKITAVKN